MATLTVRDLDDELKARLRVRAAENGRSMEAEVRAILRETLTLPTPSGRVGTRVHRRFASLDAVELAQPSRGEPPRAADLSE